MYLHILLYFIFTVLSEMYFIYAVVPSSPLLINTSISHYITEYWVKFQWWTPSDKEEVDNYTLILSTDENVIEMSITDGRAEYHLMLNYSTNYSVTFYGNNCAGRGNSTSFDIFEGKEELLVARYVYPSL